MEKQVILNEQLTNFWIEDTGRLYNSKTKRWLKGGINKGYHFYEASAKTGANVSESFKYLFEGMFNRTIDNRSKYVY